MRSTESPGRIEHAQSTHDTPTPFNDLTPQGDNQESRRRRARLQRLQIAGTAILAIAVTAGTAVVIGASRTDTTSTVAGNQLAIRAYALLAGSSAKSWSAVAAKDSPSVVAISVTPPPSAQASGQASDSGVDGSGVVWDSRGDIVTNNHVVAAFGSAAAITVQMGAQTTYQAHVVGTDPSTDLAVIRLTDPPKAMVPITRATMSTVAVGEPVMALGNPLGLSGTVTTGIVSALNRPMATRAVGTPLLPDRVADGSAGQPVVTDAIQTSAAINPGNSGGALVNDGGALIGINSAIASLSTTQSQSGNIGIGFAIPVNEVVNVVSQLLSSGHVVHAHLGLVTSDATVTEGTVQISGAGIRTVSSGGPADSAGLRTDDLITAIDGTPVPSTEGLVGQVRALSVGKVAHLTVIRNGQNLVIPVTLGEAR